VLQFRLHRVMGSIDTVGVTYGITGLGQNKSLGRADPALPARLHAASHPLN